MADTVIWKGTLELQLQKPKWGFTAEGVSLEIAYEGPIATCHTERPKTGTAVDGFDQYGLTVTRSEIEQLDGEAGRLTVYLDSPSDADGGEDASTEPIGDPEYGLEWFAHGLTLEEHPRCGRLIADRPYYKPDGSVGTSADGKQREWSDWVSLDASDYDSSFSRGPGLPAIWTLAQYKALKELGVDSCEIYIPSVTRTTYYLRSPGNFGAAVNKKQNPPAEAGAPSTGWQYRKVGDSMRREGRLRMRTESWLGATYLPPNLFETSSP